MAHFERPALPQSELVGQVRAHLPAGASAWLVGGALRDALLRRPVRDFDFVVAGDALAGARAVANALGGAYYPLDAERGVGRVVLETPQGRVTLDLARLRGPDLPADLTARDFTLNAMAVDLARPAELIDPLHGERDLRGRLIRACSTTAIADDPLRAIRAVRLAAELRFRIDKLTLLEIRAQAARLASVSAERRRDELMHCLGGARPAAAVRSLDLLGLMPALLPELSALHGVTQSPPHVDDVWEHTLTVLQRLTEILAVLGPVYNSDAASDLTLGLVSLRLGRHRQALAEHLAAAAGEYTGHPPAPLLLASLLHDIGKPATRTVEAGGRIRFFNHDQLGADLTRERLTALRYSSDEVQRLSAIVAHHLRPLNLSGEPEVTRRAVYRYFHQTGAAGIDVVLLALADFLGTYGDSAPPVDDWNRLLDVCSALLRAYFETPEQTVRPAAVLTGDDLIRDFGLRPGPDLGKLLAELREAQAAGEVSEREGAAEWVRAYLAQHAE